MSKVKLHAVALLAIIASFATVLPAFAAGAANDHTVLILSSSVSGGAFSDEAVAATALGMDVEFATAAQWASKSTEDFATYRAIVLGDPTCAGNSAFSIGAAETSTATWGPAITGNIFIMGSDPVYHGKQAVADKGIAFAIADTGKTGAYITLSCYYHDTAPGTAVTVLSYFGTFTVTGVGCYNDVHITATHESLTGLTDAYLSNWFCSVHEGFDSWPTLDFQVLAIAEDIGSYYTAPDGSVGTPYILARGATVISDIDLEPLTATVTTGTNHTLTATVTADDVPVSGTTVTFTILAGPNAGETSSSSTDINGQTTWTYTSATAGTDQVQATFVDGDGNTQSSDIVDVVWEEPELEITDQPDDYTACTNTTATFTVGIIGDGATFQWYKDGVGALSDGGNVSGATTATLTLSNVSTADAGDYYVIVSLGTTNLTSDMATLTVHAPPTITVALSPNTLWPANHQMNTIAADVDVTGNCGPLVVTLVSVTSSEPDDANGNGDGNTVNDVQGVGTGVAAIDDYSFSVRAERAAGGSGRTYTATYRVTDAAGNWVEGTATVFVPHNQ
jgi:hypothetical protein